MQTITTVDIVRLAIAIFGFCYTAHSLRKASNRRKLMYVTPILWFMTNIILIGYCLHCPNRAYGIQNLTKSMLTSIAQIIGFISYISTAYVCNVLLADTCSLEKIQEVTANDANS